MSLIVPHRCVQIEQRPGGRRVAKVLAHPKYRMDPDTGRLGVANDTLLVPDGAGGWKAHENNFRTNFRRWADEDNLLTVVHDRRQDHPENRAAGDVELTMRLIVMRWTNDEGAEKVIGEPAHASGEVTGNGILWRNVFGAGIDLHYQVNTDQVAKEFILRDKVSCPAVIKAGTNPRLEILVGLRSTGATVRLDDGAWLGNKTRFKHAKLKDETRLNTKFRFADPLAYDSAGGADILEHVGTLDVEYGRPWSTATMAWPAKFFDDAVYPVYLDPTYTWGNDDGGTPTTYTGVLDTNRIRDGSVSSTVYHQSDTVWLGSQNSTGSRFAGLFAFDISAIPAGSTIDAASLTVYAYTVAGASEINCHEVKRAYTPSQASWNNYASGSPWQTAGCRGSNDVVGAVTSNTGWAAQTAYSTVDFITLSGLASVVQTELDDDAVCRWRLAQTHYDNLACNVANATWGSEDQRPFMTIEFTEPAGGAVSVTPGSASTAATGYAPTAANNTAVSVTPGAATVATTGYAPAAANNTAVAVTPGVGAIGATGYAPTVSVDSSVSAEPGTATVTATGFAPSPSIAVSVTPGVASVAVTGYAVTATNNLSVAVSPDPATVGATGHAPSISAGAAISVTPGAATVAIAGYAPEIQTAVWAAAEAASTNWTPATPATTDWSN